MHVELEFRSPFPLPARERTCVRNYSENSLIAVSSLLAGMVTLSRNQRSNRKNRVSCISNSLISSPGWSGYGDSFRLGSCCVFVHLLADHARTRSYRGRIFDQQRLRLRGTGRSLLAGTLADCSLCIGMSRNRIVYEKKVQAIERSEVQMKSFFLTLTLAGLMVMGGCKSSTPSDAYTSGGRADSGASCSEPENPYDEGSGRYSGFEWAENNNPGFCDGNSQSFIEGCEEYQRQETKYANCEAANRN